MVEFSLITPPFAMNLFVINSMAKDIPIRQTFRDAFPFVLTDIFRVIILTTFPTLALGLVWLFY